MSPIVVWLFFYKMRFWPMAPVHSFGQKKLILCDSVRCLELKISNNHVGENMRNKSVATLEGMSALALYSSMAVGSKYNFPEPQSVIAQDIYDQHIALLWICLVIFIGVFGVMFYSVLKHRKSLGYKAANFHHSTTVEVIWTVIPCLI